MLQAIKAVNNHKFTVLLSVIGILLISVVFRFYHLSELFYFSLDEEVISFNVRQIVLGKHYPAIGVNAADTGLYLGPGYFYISVPFFYIFHNSPIGGAIMSSLLGICTTAAIYWFSIKIGNDNRSSLIAAFFHASSFTVAIFERKFFNAQPVIFLSVAIIGLTLMFVKRNNKKILWLLALCMGLVFHVNLMLIPCIITSTIFIIRSKPSMKARDWAVGFLIICSIISPLLFFDIRHNFKLSKSFISFPAKTISARQSWNVNAIKKTKDITQFIPKIISQNQLFGNNIVQESVTCIQAPKNHANIIGIIVVVIGLIASLFAIKSNNQIIPLYIYLLINIVSILFYPGSIREYYYQILVVPTLLLLGCGYGYLLLKWRNAGMGIFVLLIIILSTNITQLINAYNPHGFLRMKEITKKIVTETSQPFSLSFSGDACYGYGFDYLLTINQHENSISFEDSIIGWLKNNNNEYVSKTKKLVDACIYANQDALEVKITKL